MACNKPSINVSCDYHHLIITGRTVTGAVFAVEITGKGKENGLGVIRLPLWKRKRHFTALSTTFSLCGR